MARDHLALVRDRLLAAHCHAFLRDGELMVEQVFGEPVPEELVAAVREVKAELTEWLTWEKDADVLWRAVLRRHAHRVDLVEDEVFQAHVRRAEKAHARHDRERLVRWLLAMERHANQTADRGEAGSRSFAGLDEFMREPARRTL